MKKAHAFLEAVRYAAAGAALLSGSVSAVFQTTNAQNWMAAAVGSIIMLAIVRARHMI